MLKIDFYKVSKKYTSYIFYCKKYNKNKKKPAKRLLLVFK